MDSKAPTGGLSAQMTVDRLADRITALPGRAIVAIDGVDGSGKTTFADRLALLVQRQSRAIIRASVNGFHHPRSVRYRRGKADPLGFFLDSYDYRTLRSDLIAPFRNGAAEIATARFDHRSDQAVEIRCRVGAADVVLLDGIFLHRDELNGAWDLSVFLSVPFSVSYARMAARDGSDPDPTAESYRRYYEGQRIYLRTCRPERRASVVLDNAVDL